jgi:PII-like signaling protein
MAYSNPPYYEANIFVDKGDLHRGRSLHEFILRFLLSSGIIGATVIEGHSGYGRNQHIQDPNRLFSFDEPPILIKFIDQEAKVRNVLAELRKHTNKGLFTIQPVEVF